MLPPLHKLGRRADERAHAEDMTRRFENLAPDLQEHIFELLSNNDDPCQRDTQRACHNAATRDMHAWCINHFDQLCHNPPNVVLQNQPSPFVGAVSPFLCNAVGGGNNGYNPYDKPQMQWRQQFALFCNIVYGMDQWMSTLAGPTLATRRQVFDALRSLDNNMIQFPPIINAMVPAFPTPLPATVFKGLGRLDIDHLPESVQTISAEAFCGCTGITAMRLPQGLQFIGTEAFAHTSIEAIDIPNSVTTIQEAAFFFCNRLQHVTLPENNVLVEVTTRLFDNCNALVHIDIPDSIQRIGNRAFEMCANLRTIRWSANLHRIGSAAFVGCNGLTIVTLPATLRHMELHAFRDCNSLTSVDQLRAPDANLGIDTIHVGTFQDCFRLTHAPLLRRVFARIEQNAFFGCRRLRSDKEHPLPFNPNLYRIDEAAFQGCESLQYVTLPDSVGILGHAVFHRCTNLHEVRLPENQRLAQIPDSCFSYSGLQRIHLPRNVVSIGRNAFYTCRYLQTVVYHPHDDGQVHARYINERAFMHCTNLAELTPPRVIALYIEDFAFNGCTLLARVTSIIRYIGKQAFEGCTNLRRFTFLPFANGDTLRDIGNSCFERCIALEQITIPDSVVRIGRGCFNRCYNLNTVHLGAEVETIPSHAFAFCRSLTEIHIPSRVQRLDFGCFTRCDRLRTVTFDTVNSVLSDIGVDAFSGCTSLQEIAIPHTVERIRAQAFSGCTALRRVTFSRGPNDEPPSIVAIEERAFQRCENLAELELPASLVTFSTVAFPDMSIVAVAPRPEDAEDINWETPTPPSSPEESDYVPLMVMLEQGQAVPSPAGGQGEAGPSSAGGGAPAAGSVEQDDDSDDAYGQLD